jgi:hypothetical protein
LSVLEIGTDTFCGCKNLTIYCHVSRKPFGWNEFWSYYDLNGGSCEVVWGYNSGKDAGLIVKIEKEKQKRKIESIAGIITIIIIVVILFVGIWTIPTKSGELSLALSDNGDYYIVKGIGTITLTDIIIPDTYNDLPIKEVGDSAFYNCYNLTSVIISDGIIAIGDNAFGFCDHLISVTIPDSVTSIGVRSFDSCSRLKDLIIPDNTTSIGYGAFYGCENLCSVTFKNISGWYFSSSSNNANRINISSSYLSDASIAAKYLTKTYCLYYWFCG